jgi:DNA-directed RNA polymerase specialized sigma subunit
MGGCIVPLDMGDRRTDRRGGDEEFLAWLETLPDAHARYEHATAALEQHQQAVRRLSALRADAAAVFYEEGESLATIAKRLGVSRARVHQLVQEAQSRAKPARSPRRRSARKDKNQ